MYVDNCSMQLVLNPGQFDVMVCENMFGDIISDEAGATTGSIGLLPSASLGDEGALYEPIHGSAPDIAGQDKANPLAAILSVAMLFEYTAAAPELAPPHRATPSARCWWRATARGTSCAASATAASAWWARAPWVTRSFSSWGA